ncbi:MAG TPA: dethiobiotin synthase [Acidimicrobiales bacterium]|nr:dethiobiotin synthase [Acidimicrobiales bacterium]
MARPEHLVLVTGTGTGTGKTWVGAQLLAAWRSGGHTVAARKPVQSYDPGVETSDAEVLASATAEEPEWVCPGHRWYEVPMAPPIAAELLERPGFSVEDLVNELAWPDGVRYGLVEGVGGPRSPIASSGDTVALAEAVMPDTVVLVAPTELGTINAVLLAASVLDHPVVFLNRYREDSPLHARNAEWLRERSGLEVVTDLDTLVSRLS